MGTTRQANADNNETKALWPLKNRPQNPNTLEDAMDTDDDYDPYLRDGIVLLKHQCDEWYVGGRAGVKRMIQKLNALLKDGDLKP